MYFNNQSRMKNVKLISVTFLLNQIIKALMSFIYRIIFVSILSKEYLGITGLFSNITVVFSLADLGIGSIIIYYLYEPISNDDTDRVAELMNFYKRFYNIVAISLLILGLILMPFLRFLIKDMSEVPNGINIYYVYLIYVIQNVISYVFVYRQSLLEADQRGYIKAIVDIIVNVLQYSIMTLILIITKCYIATLLINIVITVVSNYIFSRYTYEKYKEVFKKKNRLNKCDVKKIIIDAKALMCHKIGYVILMATDNLVLSKYVGIIAVGVYSNYQMITTTLNSIVNSLLGNITSSIGNYNITAKSDEKHSLYKKLQFVNMWINNFCTGCICVLVNPFIYTLWSDKTLILEKNVVIFITISLNITLSNIINTSFINSSGLFVKDKIRTILEAGLNLVISVILAKKIGITGVIIGTIISNLLTSWWRVPYLAYKYIFERSCIEYFKKYFQWTIVTVVGYIGIEYVCNMFPNTILYFIIKTVICVIGFNGLFLICFGRTDEFKYIWKKLIKRKSRNGGE